MRDNQECRYSQSSNTEHDGNAKLLLPMHPQALEVPERDSEHPNIEDDVDDCVGPGYGVRVGASTFVKAIPFRPKVMSRLALCKCGDEEGDAPDSSKDQGPPDHATAIWAREDAQEEAQDTQLHQRDLHKV